MNKFYQSKLLEAGVDEVARGCLFGRVYSAAVIWRTQEDLNNLLKLNNIQEEKLQDSKKLTREKRNYLKNYIEAFSLDYSVAWCEPNEIDLLNIREATFKSMHIALDNLKLKPELIVVDGNAFKEYKNINHECLVKGDQKVTSISAASILAKVYHDNYIFDLCQESPELNKYDLISNMGYGSKNHLNAIKKYGITKFHRKTFGICKEF